MIILALLLLIAPSGSDIDPFRAWLAARPSVVLAREMGVQNAEAVTRHQVESPVRGAPPAPPGAPASAVVSFFFPARQAGGGICRREVSSVAVEKAGAEGIRATPPVRIRTELSLTSACNDLPARFASLNSGLTTDDAIEALARLHTVQTEIRAGSQVGMTLRCFSEFAAYVCPAAASEVVAALPLDRIYLMERNGRTIRAVATEGEPGELMWDIKLHPGGIDVSRSIPPPF